MKYQILIISLLFFGFCGYTQNSKSIKVFSQGSSSFKGSKYAQATYLLRNVKPMAIIDEKKRIIPELLGNLLNDSIKIIPVEILSNYIQLNDIALKEIGGNLALTISKNSKGISANYFVIHDVSHPNYLSKDFPENINQDSWKYNDVERSWNQKKAHVFVGRTGKSYSPVHFNIPWRATKFELEVLDKKISKGLFLHIELVQPRKSAPSKWKNNDVIAPNPGFTESQYRRLALLYICASSRANEWLVPAYHAVLDEGLRNGHDDPQNFNLDSFNDMIKIILEELN